MKLKKDIREDLSIKKLIKKILSGNYFLPFALKRRFIFVFHDISHPGDKHYSEHYSTTVENFEKAIGLLKQKFLIVPLDKLAAPMEMPAEKPWASIAFDDGFSSVLRNAYPLLNKEQLPFAVFASKTAVKMNQLWVSNIELKKDDKKYLEKIYEYALNGKVNFEHYITDPVSALRDNSVFDEGFRDVCLTEPPQKKLYMDEKDLTFLSAEGVLIGSHTCDHFVMSRCEQTEAGRQISENKSYLENLLGMDIKHFAFPFGKKQHYNEKTVQQVFAAGHKSVYTTAIGNFAYTDINRKDFLFPRIPLHNFSADRIMLYINRTFAGNTPLLKKLKPLLAGNS